MTSMLYEYTQTEKDICTLAFRAGNYVELRKLPNAIQTFNISQSRKENVRTAEINSKI